MKEPGNPSARANRRRPRVLFYSHDAIGLGHLSRVAVQMNALGRIRPDAVQLVVTGAQNPNAFPLPKSADVVRLPVAARAHLYRDLPEATELPSVAFTETGIWQLRARIIEAAAIGFAPDIVCVDHQPEGIYGELIPAIESLKRTAPSTKFVALLDDFMDHPSSVARRWENPRDLLMTAYDRVVIRGDRAVYDTVAAYRFPPEVLAKTSYSGYVVRKPHRGRDSAGIKRIYGSAGLPLILVTVGSGRDGDRIVETYLSALGVAGNPGFASLIVLGSAMPPGKVRSLTATAKALPQTTVLEFVEDVPSLMRVADLVVSMAGYSAIGELLHLGKRAVVIPRAKPWAEQLLRAQRLDELGLITMLHPDRLDPETLWSALLRGLSAQPPTTLVDCGGDVTIARLIDELLPT